MLARLVCYALSVVLLTGCAGASGQRRLSRTLGALGVATVLVGGLVATGCNDAANGYYGCSGGPSTADPQEGVPIMAVGAALIGAGFLAKPREQGRLFPGLARTPVPWAPGPLLAPYSPYLQ